MSTEFLVIDQAQSHRAFEAGEAGVRSFEQQVPEVPAEPLGSAAEPWYARLADEREELADRIVRLTAFVCRPTTLDRTKPEGRAEYDRLRAQLHQMLGLLDILDQRLLAVQAEEAKVHAQSAFGQSDRSYHPSYGGIALLSNNPQDNVILCGNMPYGD